MTGRLGCKLKTLEKFGKDLEINKNSETLSTVKF